MRKNKVLFCFLFFLILSLLFTMQSQAVSKNPDLPVVVIVTTGGTIAEKIDSETGASVPALSGAELIEAVPSLSDVANIKVVNFSNIDSSQMTPELWYELSKTVDNILEDTGIIGVVVTHGTDTMEEGAYFLDLTLASDKPVVFVGSMRNASDLSPDGPANLLNGVIQVCSQEARDWGVTVTLNQYINSAKDVRKTQTTNVQTFFSGDKGYLGYISNGKVYRLNDRLYRQRLPLPQELPKVVLISTYAGADGSLVRYAVDSGAKGLIVEGVGSGNVNEATYEAIEYAIDKGVPVVLTSRVYYGRVYPIYGGPGGGLTLEKSGVILAGNLTGSKARILLMLALPQVEGNHSKLKEFFK